MSNCPSTATCIFFNDKMVNKPALTNMYKMRYCKDNNDICARWRIATTLGKELIPEDLFPNELDRANEIINKKLENIK